MSDGSSDSEERTKTYVLLAMAGSDDAFSELVRMHQGKLIALLTRVCGSRAVAEDVAQAAFLKAWRNVRNLRDASLFRPWLRQIAMRAAIDAARASAAPAMEDDSALEHAAISADARLDLAAALAKLTVAQRACVLLSYGEGMSHAEIAGELDMPAGTVKSHVARGARVLRELLSDREV